MLLGNVSGSAAKDAFPRRPLVQQRHLVFFGKLLEDAFSGFASLPHIIPQFA
jgi:hypothetical protein